ncbi:MAG: dihydrodipicolinate synthase family protein, partial [Planctomycetes bacterium]|nr:dihydrodipicolinate synthase family protein [Planctomycetota bacterium]
MTKTATLPRPLRGIVPPMLTPITDRDTLDLPGLERLVEHILAGEPSGLFILGTSGEAPSLSYRMRHELIDRVAEQVAGRVPLLVGITDTAFVESVEVADYADDAGAQAVVLAPPPYFPTGQADLARYVEKIAAELPLPVFLYNMPSHTKLTFEPETVARLMDVPNVVGLKDSSANMIYFHRLRELAADRPDFSLLVGPEELLAEALLLGAHGGVSGGANLAPRLYVDLYHAATDRDLDRVAELHAQVMQISGALYTVDRDGSGVIKGLKCALSVLGICSDQVAEPLARLAPPERELIRQRLGRLEFLLVAPVSAEK